MGTGTKAAQDAALVTCSSGAMVADSEIKSHNLMFDPNGRGRTADDKSSAVVSDIAAIML